uniref:Uncharacterized protein n=1 Tax=Parascaris univalens TaxID=6257 RepID=A0A915B2Z1_PARUN
MDRSISPFLSSSTRASYSRRISPEWIIPTDDVFFRRNHHLYNLNFYSLTVSFASLSSLISLTHPQSCSSLWAFSASYLYLPLCR